MPACAGMTAGGRAPPSGVQRAIRRSLIADIDWLITVDAERRIIRDAAVAVDKGKIVAIGKSAEIAKPASPARQRIDGRRTVATPGFIDCHLHSSFALSRGLADEANAQSFLFDRMYPYEAALEERRRAHLGDAGGGRAAQARRHLLHRSRQLSPRGRRSTAIMATGIRAIVSRSSFDLTKSVLGILPERMIETTSVALERAEAVLARYAKSGNPRLGASASFRGLNNASDELILGLDQLARKYGTLLQTHACFSYSTHDSSVARTGMAEIERLEALGVIDERMLIVHSGWLEPEEVAILVEAQAVAGLRAELEPAQRLRQLPVRQAAGAARARRQCRDRLGSCQLRHRRHGAGGPAGLLLLQGDADQPARDAARDRARNGDAQRGEGRAAGTTASARSRSARRPTSSCSTPTGRNGNR